MNPNFRIEIQISDVILVTLSAIMGLSHDNPVLEETGVLVENHCQMPSHW